jgi:voltage-gated potassium channel
VPLAMIAGGTVGYHWIERWSWFYSFYVTVITLTSIGYGEAKPLSNVGRLFTMVLAVGGISTFALAGTQLLSLIITGALRDSRNERRMEKRIVLRARDRVGYGDVGRHLRESPAPAFLSSSSIASPRRWGCRQGGRSVRARRRDGGRGARRAGIKRARALTPSRQRRRQRSHLMTARLLRPGSHRRARRRRRIS